MPLSSYSDPVLAAIKAALQADFTDVPIIWENVQYDPETQEAFILAEFRRVTESQETIGAEAQGTNRWDANGVVDFNICIKKGIGADAAHGVGTRIYDLLRARRLINGDLTFYDGSSYQTQRDDLNGWFVITKSVEWLHVDCFRP